MRKNQLPDFLKPADKVVIISPSGNIDNNYMVGAKTILESWNLKVEVAPHADSKLGRFCGSINQRLSDIQDAMNDNETKMIFCSRGGYGTVHLLEKLDFKKINKNPKWLVGYSDITAIHQAFLNNKIVSLHAPMAKHLTEDSKDKASLYLRDTLFGNIPKYELPAHCLNIEGEAQGVLFGGNLSVLCSLAGSVYSTLPENGILFIEDIAESPYKIDRMMWTLKLAGVFSRINGLIVGQFTDYEEDPLMYSSVYESIKSIACEYNIATAFDFPTGHVKQNYPLLHGSNVKLRVSKDEVLLQQYV